MAHHAYEEGHQIGWEEARILQIETNSRYIKYKDSAHMECLTNMINQSCLKISLIRGLLTRKPGKFGVSGLCS
jgi:hypothetical protein